MKRNWLDKNREKNRAMCMELMFFDFNGKTRRFFREAKADPGGGSDGERRTPRELV